MQTNVNQDSKDNLTETWSPRRYRLLRVVYYVIEVVIAHCGEPSEIEATVAAASALPHQTTIAKRLVSMLQSNRYNNELSTTIETIRNSSPIWAILHEGITNAADKVWMPVLSANGTARATSTVAMNEMLVAVDEAKQRKRLRRVFPEAAMQKQQGSTVR